MSRSPCAAAFSCPLVFLMVSVYVPASSVIRQSWPLAFAIWIAWRRLVGDPSTVGSGVGLKLQLAERAERAFNSRKTTTRGAALTIRCKRGFHHPDRPMSPSPCSTYRYRATVFPPHLIPSGLPATLRVTASSRHFSVNEPSGPLPEVVNGVYGGFSI